MEVIMIEAKEFNELKEKIDSIFQFIQQQFSDKQPDLTEMWVDNYDVCTFLKISERTLQRLRSDRKISYSIITGKCYYSIAEIKQLLQKKLIKSTEDRLNDLINNHSLHAQQRRYIK